MSLKSQMGNQGFEYIHFMETTNINIATFRCDNVGEYIKFKEKLVQIRKNVNGKFLAPHKPQQNRIVEKAFATLYGRVWAISNYTFFEGDLHQKLWAECAKLLRS